MDFVGVLVSGMPQLLGRRPGLSGGYDIDISPPTSPEDIAPTLSPAPPPVPDLVAAGPWSNPGPCMGDTSFTLLLVLECPGSPCLHPT